MESSKKELKELRGKVSHLQADLADREVKGREHSQAYLLQQVTKKHTR